MISKNPNNAIIFAQEITKGMKSLGPKCLLVINKNITIIEYQIQYLKKYYPTIKISICTGFEQDKIIRTTNKFKNIQYYYNPNYEQTNEAETLIGCIKKLNITNNVLVISGGLVPVAKIQIRTDKSSIQITDKIQKIPFEIGTSNYKTSPYLFYGLPFKWTESIFLNQEAISNILTISKSRVCNNIFLFELINLLIENGIHIDIQHIEKNLPIKLNNIKDLTTVKKHYEKHMLNKIKR